MQDRISELQNLVQKARRDYYSGEAKVTDEVYDGWIDELTELQEDNPAVTAIGFAPVSSWPKVHHGLPMGSLDKVQTIDEMTGWIFKVSRKGREELLVTDKLDGISIHVVYEKGKPVRAITRGDGTIGEDITQNVLRMNGIVPKLPGKFSGSLRGEIVLHKEDLVHFPGKTSTRNTASGTAKRYDGKGCERLTVYFYQIVEGLDVTTGSQQLEQLQKWGFKIPKWYVTAMTPGVKTPQDIWVDYQQWTRDSLPYDIDGLVVGINDLEYCQSLGERDGRPNGAVAFKFAPVAKETVVRSIEHQVGTTGHVTPVLLFDPVQLFGAVVSKASAYNYGYIEKLGIDIGAHVIVARANDVIPRCVSVTKGTGSVALPPTNCPSCGYELVHEGEYICCPNKIGCKAQLAGAVEHWLSEIGVLEWGHTTIEKLVEAGLVCRLSDLYRLTEDDLTSLQRLGSKVAKTMLNNLQAANPIELSKYLGALCVPLCGSSTFELLIGSGFNSVEKIANASYENLMAIKGFGPVRAKALTSWFHSGGLQIVRSLQEAGVTVKLPTVGNLTGKSFCFTGTMKRKRSELESAVIENGGTVKSSVTKDLTYLVLADPNANSTKIQAARKNGTKCISENEFALMARL